MAGGDNDGGGKSKIPDDETQQSNGGELEAQDDFKARITKQTVTSVTIDWNLITHADVYKVEKYSKKVLGWTKEAWVIKGPATIGGLDENFAYRFRIQALQYSAASKEYVNLASSSQIVVNQAGAYWFPGSTLTALPSTICLYRAIRKGQQFLVKRLLRRRPSLIDYPAPNGYLPLANAIQVGEMSIIDSLLTAGASAHVGNPWNHRTPLHMAFYHGRLRAARLLLLRSADMEARDIMGMSACHFAVDANQLDILRFALERGANVEARDACGWTLLLRGVVMRADLDILQLLVLHGADVGAVDWLGQSHADLARFYGNMEGTAYINQFLSKQKINKL